MQTLFGGSARPSLAQYLCHSLPPILAYRAGKYFLARENGDGPTTFAIATITGSVYGFTSGDIVADSVRICGFWDWRNIALAEIFCGAGGHVVEIGANTGTETLGFVDVVGPTGRVTAFEPDRDNFAALETNVRRNGHGNVVLHRAAVAETSGTIRFSPPAADENSGMGYVSLDSGTRPTVEVPAVTIDSITSELRDAQFISIDVEGYEVSLLRGAREYFGANRPVLVLEAHAAALERAKSDVRTLMAELRALRYVVYEIRRFGVRPMVVEGIDDDSYVRNWLALPSEREAEVRKVRPAFARWAFAPRIGLFRKT